MKKLLLLALAAPLLAGCPSMGGLVKEGDFQNGLLMSTSCDRVKVDSEWFGLFGITARIVQKDAQPVLDALCKRQAPAAAPAPAASAAK